MRLRTVLLAALVLVSAGYIHLLGYTRDLESRAGAALHRAAFEKDLRLSGLTIIGAEELHALLPADRSVAWWHLHRRDVETALEKHPLVANASVARCGALQWGCFTVAVEERRPEFVTRLGDKAWLVGADGVFMGRAPLAAVDPAAPQAEGYAPVVLQGVDFGGSSPDLVRARLAAVRSAIRVLEEGTGQKVRAASFVGANDLEVRFDGLPFSATFELPDKGDDRLRDEAARFKRLYGELGEKHRLVKSIDLAFDRVAVVKFID